MLPCRQTFIINWLDCLYVCSVSTSPTYYIAINFDRLQKVNGFIHS